MNWTAANEQRQDALLRIFYMLIIMVLLIVRAGLDSRIASATLPPEPATPPGVVPPFRNLRSSVPPSHLYPAALRLLRAAEAASRRLADMARAVYELMNQAHALALSGRGRTCESAQRPQRTSERLDTS